MVIIAKNITLQEVPIEDLGITFSASEIKTLSDFFKEKLILDSSDLKTAIDSGKIILNNGSVDLSLDDSLNYLDIRTEYESNIVESKQKNVITLSFNESNDHYYIETHSNSWDVMSQFLFRGSNICGIPISCKVISWIEDINKIGKFRLYDMTHNLVICSYNNISTTTPNIFTTSTLNNIPINESIFEIHLLSTWSKKVYISNFTLVF